jgi:hypothetical protein
MAQENATPKRAIAEYLFNIMFFVLRFLKNKSASLLLCCDYVGHYAAARFAP